MAATNFHFPAFQHHQVFSLFVQMDPNGIESNICLGIFG